jgi:hypothetical protein
MVRRLFSPPTTPALIGPRTAHGTEHVAAQNVRAYAGETLFRQVVVDAGLATLEIVHGAPHAGLKKWIKDFGAANAERMLEVLPWTCRKSVQRHGKISNVDSWHE